MPESRWSSRVSIRSWTIGSRRIVPWTVSLIVLNSGIRFGEGHHDDKGVLGRALPPTKRIWSGLRYRRSRPGDRAANVTDCRSVLKGFDSLPGHPSFSGFTRVGS